MSGVTPVSTVASDEPALIEVPGPAAAARDFCPLRDGLGKNGFIAITFARRHHWPHVDLAEAVADANALRNADEVLDERVVHRLVHVDPLGRGADLSGVEEARERNTAGGYVDRR
jgi:hypothetical protein